MRKLKRIEVIVKFSYKSFTVASKYGENQGPHFSSTQTIGCNCTHVTGPYILHPATDIGYMINLTFFLIKVHFHFIYFYKEFIILLEGNVLLK